MKKIKYLLLSSIVFIASCAANGNNMGNQIIDGIPFDYLYEFNYQDSDYQVLFPSNNNKATYYMYYETDYTTEVNTWTINYYYECIYLVEEGFSNDELLEALYNSLNANLSLINNLLTYEIKIEAPNNKYEEEITINNPFNDKINCVVVDKYLPLRIKGEDNKTYTISIPIDREYLAKCNEQIESVIDKTIISWEDFLAIPNLYKANY